jgi:hypothetical protein
MGTRADFYVGTGPEAEWLGSVAWDGYEWAEKDSCDIPNCPIRQAKTEDEYRKAVKAMLEDRDDGTLPENGWPWPWETSATSDYAYYWKDNCLGWESRTDWPNMKDKKNVTFGKRSGLIIIQKNSMGVPGIADIK